ncbi:MAG: diaminopimelate decarboxylase [Candidatus Odinarchaeota archaeon]
MDYQNWLEFKDLKYINDVLYFSEVSTNKIANDYKTPVYVINDRIIRKRYFTLKENLDLVYKNNNIHYAVKANTNIAVLKILLSIGSNFDCTSLGEIYTCLKVGVKPKQIIYTGNMFTNEDLIYAVQNDITINLDSISQLYRLEKVYDKLDKEKDLISFRINPELGAGHHIHTITAGKDIKFGILEHQVIQAYKAAVELGFKKFGIHTHIGSGILNMFDYEKPMEKYLEIIKMLSKTLGLTFEFVDFGGGFGIPYRPNEDPINLEHYNNVVIEKFKALIEEGNIGKPKLLIEPGRYISAESSILLVQVNTIKDNGYKLFAGINAGFNSLIRPTLYGSYHHIIPCNYNDKKQQFNYDIAGPICESGDILGKDRELSKLSEEDFLAILDAGAYGFSMSSNYNSRLRPAEILIHNKNIYTVREAEKYDDLLSYQKLPDYLKK